MTHFRTLGVAVLSVLAFAPSAFAQDFTSASGKRVAIVGGGALMHPDSDPQPGSRIDIDGALAPTLSASWYVNDNVAFELWGAADQFNHRVRGDQGKVGTVEQQPVALSGQFHFGTPDSIFRPFLGLGYFESNFSNEDISGDDGLHLGLETANGAIATAGLDINISDTWFARTDLRYMDAESDVNLAGARSGQSFDMDPWTLGLGLGARF